MVLIQHCSQSGNAKQTLNYFGFPVHCLQVNTVCKSILSASQYCLQVNTVCKSILSASQYCLQVNYSYRTSKNPLIDISGLKFMLLVFYSVTFFHMGIA